MATEQTFEELVQLQNNEGTALQKLVVNVKKTPGERRTPKLLEGKIAELEVLWASFLQRHEVMKGKAEPYARSTHPYFADNFFNKIKEIYEKAKTEFAAMVEVAKNKTMQIEAQASGSTEVNPTWTKMMKFIGLVQNTIDQCLSENTPRSTQFYELKLRTIEQHWRHAQVLHEQMWTSNDYNLDEYLSCESEINDGILAIQERMVDKSTKPQATNVMGSNCKLPRVELPKFDGDYLYWRQYHDLFVELVENTSLSPCQKLLYLKSSLTGEAEKLIQHFATTAANYEAAWRTLLDRYDNKRILVGTLVQKLLCQPIAQNDSASTLKVLHDTTQECLLSLQNLEVDTKGWDPILLHVLVQRVSKTTHNLWEQSLKEPKSLPTLREFMEFLKWRFQSLEATSSKKSGTADTAYRALSVAMPTKGKCFVCKGDHPIFRCTQFEKLTPKQRVKAVQTVNHCVNCLRSGHRARDCTSGACQKCKKKHNTLLHLERSSLVAVPNNNKEGSSTNTSLTSVQQRNSVVLLSTSQLTIIDHKGDPIICRALLDTGSQLNFITKRLAKKLGLQSASSTISVEGIGKTKASARLRVVLKIKSCHTAFFTQIEAHILPQIVSEQPSCTFDTAQWNIPTNITLADPQFNKPGPVDILIGAGIFYSLLSVGQISLGNGRPTLQNSVLGWLVGGEYQGNTQKLTCGLGIEDLQVNHSLEKFWALEETSSTEKNFTAAEVKIENEYMQNVRRNEQGRYIVKLPFIGHPSQLGESKELARQRFYAIERKLAKNPELKKQYTEFMREYERMQHMSEIALEEVKIPHYFLPHHAVLKPDSTTTKCRVVFDASAKTSSNASLNDLLATGPVLQDDLFSILMRFRRHRFVFTADIAKMYRQILINNDDKRYQLIWWREEPTQSLKCYQLNTVTYGTTCAPYLAIKTLRTLANEGESAFPLATEAIRKNFYVDDVLTGSDSMSTAQEVQRQLIKLLSTAGLKLRKWSANHSTLLQEIPPKDQEAVSLFHDEGNQTIKTMGLVWNPTKDTFNVKVDQQEHKKLTKRTALSDVAQLFDPLGFFAPVVVTAKIFLQELWKLKLDWDAALPQELHTRWSKFRTELGSLKDLSVPRHLFAGNIPGNVQLHIFADASERAYGAVAYVRIIVEKTIIVRFVCAKSRVAPVKQISLPKLELCAAVLATELRQRLQQTMAFQIDETYMWSDSTIVLSWINSDASHYYTFVANRIANIQRSSSPREWRHVGSKENPADLVSRGLMPTQLVENNLWFYGPRFLHGSMSIWPLQPPRSESCEIEKRANQKTVLSASGDNADIWTQINHKNCFRRLQRIIAYIRRFKGNQGTDRPLVPTALELEASLIDIIKHIQLVGFGEDMKYLRKNKQFDPRSSLSNLTPFLDNQGVIRVGGRLENANVSFDAKHPILLPSSHLFVKLLITTMHKENLHTGVQSLLAIVRQRFWPIRGKDLVRSVIKSCVHCARAKPQMLQQLMGNLPADRVQPARPFINAGVDFFGPVWIHYKIRGKRPTKAYVAVFCCFATKAVHMEVVSDLSTDAFIGALKRFIARRGCCKKLYSDNATNFVGASNKLQELEQIIYHDQSKQRILAECGKRNIEFIFIPPSAPHVGGLWEAAVKSAKHLLNKSLVSANLTYEELETVVTEAEAILNSRPLTPLSNDPNDLTALTPGHFLIGEPLTTMQDPTAENKTLSKLERWKLVTQIKSEFWRRWVHEYLCCLQQRNKWKNINENAKPGMMVLIKDENTTPLKWPLGRIIKAVKGSDGLVRVVDVQTASKVLRRPIHKLALLPVEEDNSSSLESASNSKGVQRKSSENLNPPPQKRSKLRFGSTVVTALLTLLFIPTISGMNTASHVTVQKFDGNPGMYFEDLGPTHLITSEWDVIVYIDLQPYYRNIDIIKGYYPLLKRVCEQTNGSSCGSIVQQTQRQITELNQNNQLLRSSQVRTKRGAINIVGKVANELFGVLDSEYAEQTANVIKTVHENEEQLAMHLRNQTSFLDATVKIIKKGEQETAAEFRNLKYGLESITNEINKVGQQVQTEQLEQKFILLSLQATLAIRYMEHIQDSLLDILTDTHHGRINPELISPEQLHTELMKIKSNLPNTLALPMNSDDTLKFYQLMKIKGRVVNKLAICRVSLPLIQNERFELIGVHAIPWETKGSSALSIIAPSFPFFIITLHKDQFCPLSEWEFSNCKTIEGDAHLCQPTHPIYKQGSVIGRCEMQLMTHNTVDKTCTVLPQEPGPFWKQLHHPNEWIYSTQTELTINAVCGTNLEQVRISESGLLTMKEYCTIKEPSVTIQGHRSTAIKTQLAVLPNVDNDTTKATISANLARVQYKPQYQMQREELLQLQNNLTILATEGVNNINKHDIHHYSMSGTCLVLIMISTGIILVHRWRKGKTSGTEQSNNIDNPTQPEQVDIEMVTVWGKPKPKNSSD